MGQVQEKIIRNNRNILGYDLHQMILDHVITQRIAVGRQKQSPKSEHYGSVHDMFLKFGACPTDPMSFYQSSSITHSNPLNLTYGMTCLTSAISFSLEKHEVVSLDCGVFYAISGLQPFNKGSMKVRCDVDAGIQVIGYSLRTDDHKSRLLSIERVSVCGVRSLFFNELIV